MNHHIRIADSDVEFTCKEGQTLLDAGLAAGIEMPYSCRKGVCGNCAGTVLQGEVQGVGGAAIRNEACAPGQVLYCMCIPAGDTVLQPVSWHRIDPSARKTFTAKVYRNQRVAEDISILQLRLPAGQRAKFKAGQYLQVLLEDGERRSYSMANPPHESDSITLHIRHVPGGLFSARVPELQPGQLLQLELPLGTFELQEGSERPMVFVAGGTGFAPVKSMLDDLVKRGIRRPATLLWGARRAEHFYLRSAVERWQKMLPGFRFVAALTGEEAPPEGLDAFRGSVPQALAAEFPSLADHELYCCGSPGMVAAVREQALQHGLAPQDFHSDVFVTGEAVATTAE